MIYVFDDLNGFSEKQYQILFEKLPPSRKKRAAVLAENEKKLAIIEYHLLKELLGLKDDVDFCYNENGKPLLYGYNFSFSRRDGVLCVAVGKSQIGVDIEKIREYDGQLAKYVLSDEEIALVEGGEEKDELFTELWTKKEATIKCLGLSMSVSLKNLIAPERFTYTSFRYSDYYICQCVLKADSSC